MATHSSVLGWRIPGTGKPGGLPSMGSHRVGHDWTDLAAAAAAWNLKMHSDCTQGANNLSESYCQEFTHFIIRRWFVKGSQELTVDLDLHEWNITIKEQWRWRGRKEQWEESLETTKNKGTKDGNNPNAHWQMTRLTKHSVYIQRGIIQPWKGMK